MKHLHNVLHATLYCFALIGLAGSSTALAQQTSPSSTNGVIDFAPKAKFLGAQFSFQANVPVANNSFDEAGARLQLGGSHYADTWQRTLTLGWDWNQASSWFTYSFTTPAGRYDPGGAWNYYSAPSSHSIMSGNTFYLTKNNATAASLSTDWEIQGQGQSVTATRPGQYFTMEWGLTRLLTLDNQKTRLLEIGIAGYDEWPLPGNVTPLPLNPLSGSTPLSEHALGFQTNLTLPEKNFSLSFKYEPDYLRHAQSRVVIVSALWTW